MSTFTVRKPKPSEKRASFFLYRFDRLPNGKRKGTSLEPKELALINQRYHDGTLKFEQAAALAEKLRAKEAAKHNETKVKPVTHTENLALLAKYWEKEYPLRRIKDQSRRSMWDSLNRAIRTLGNESILVASQETLQAKVMEITDINQQRRMISRLNQLLKFAGRDYTLELPQQEFVDIRYLTRDEVMLLAGGLGEFDRNLVLLAFATGCRLGELFAIGREVVSQPEEFYRIHVTRQIYEDLTAGPPKNRKRRKTLVLELGEPALRYWLGLSQTEKFTHRTRRFAEIVKTQAMELWPDNETKHVTFHDLRHSFAIELLRRGRSLTQVAQLLGDSYQVCEMYYTGFSMVDESLDALEKQLTKS